MKVWTSVTVIVAVLVFVGASANVVAEEPDAYRISLALYDGGDRIISPSAVILPGNVGELNVPSADGSSYIVVVSAAPSPADAKAAQSASVALSVMISSAQDQHEFVVVNSSLDVALGAVSTLPVAPHGSLVTDLRLEATVEEFELWPGWQKNKAECAQPGLAKILGGEQIQGGCCSVTCGINTLTCCGVITCCDAVCGACCHIP